MREERQSRLLVDANWRLDVSSASHISALYPFLLLRIPYWTVISYSLQEKVNRPSRYWLATPHSLNNTLCPKPPLFRGGCNGHETTSIYYASTSWYTRDISRPTIVRKLSSLQPSFKIFKSFEFEYTKGCNGQNKDHPPFKWWCGVKVNKLTLWKSMLW